MELEYVGIHTWRLEQAVQSFEDTLTDLEDMLDSGEITLDEAITLISEITQ